MGKKKRLVELKAEKKQIKKEKEEIPLLLFGLLALLFYPPYFRGLFFNHELLITHALTAILIVAVIYFKMDDESLEIFGSRIDYGAVGLLLVYIIAAFDAAVPREALKEILKLVNYLLIYYAVAHYARKWQNMERIIYTLYFSGLGVALIGIFSAVGIVNIEDTLKEGRIYSTIQYPNTLAVYILGILVLGIYLTVRQDNVYKKAGMSIANYLLFLTFLGTQSRGGLMLLPITVILLMAGALGRYRWKVFSALLIAVIPAVLIYPKSLSDIARTFAGANVAWILAGVLAAAILSWAEGRINSVLGSTKIKGSHIALGAAVLIIAGGIITVFFPLGEKAAPAFARITNISLQEKNVLERGIFYKDALEVYKDNPVLGTGGGGWAGVYKQYASYAYNSRAVHNHFLQTMVETGTVGIIMYVVVWVGFIYSVLKIIRHNSNDDEKIAIWSVFTAAVTIGLHSFIDFNLMLGAISIFFWSMFGLVRGMETGRINRQPVFGIIVDTRGRVIKNALAAGLAVFAVVSLVLYAGNSYGERGIQQLNSGELRLAEANLEKAVSMDPLNSRYKGALAQVWTLKAGEDREKQALETGLKLSRKAVALDENNADMRIIKANIHLKLEQVDEAVREYETAVKLDPTNQKRYEHLAELYLKTGEYYDYLGEKEEAKKYFAKVETVPMMITEQVGKIPFSETMPWIKNVYDLTVTDKINKMVLEAKEKLSELG